MSMPYVELFYLIIPIVFIFIIFGLNIYINTKKKKLNDFFETQKIENNPSSNQIYTNELRSLSLIKNVKNIENTEIIKEDVATMAWEIEKLKKQNFDLSVEGKQQNNKYQILNSNKIFIQIQNNSKQINKLSKRFFNTVGGVLENIKIIRGEITLYRNGLRSLKSKTLKSITVSANPKSNRIINKEFQKIEIKLKSLNDLVDSNEIDEAMSEFRDVKANFLLLIKFANSAIELEKTIFKKIPEYFHKLHSLFEQAKKNMKCELSYISFEQQMSSINDDYELLTSIFAIESWEESIKVCNNILVSLSNLNGEINGEINSYTFMLKNRENLNKYKREISKLYITIKEDFTTAYQIDKIYFSQFEDYMLNLFNFLADVDYWIEKIKNDDDNSNISFSSKQFKYKSLFYKLKGFYFSYVELTQKIEIFYLEGESNLLKFERLTILLREINSYVKSNYIILSQTENKNFIKIEEIQQKIINQILTTPKNSNPNIVNEYRKLLTLMIEYISSVGLKMEISKTFNQIVNLLAPKRSSDIKLNENIILSENSYLEGNYNLALNHIINTLNKGVN